MNAPLFAVLTVLYLLMMAALVVLALYNTVAGWLSRRELRRLQAQEQAEKATIEALPRIFYLPLGRTPALPPMMALPPYEALPGLTTPPPTYPGDLPDDLYPQYEQDFDATVLAALERLGEW